MTVRPRVLVCGWSGAGNIGDELLTAVVVERLRAVGLEPVLRSVDPGTSRTAHPGVDVVGRGVSSLRAALAVDAVVVGPGGIIQDHTSVWSLPAHLVPAGLARLRRRPVAGIGLGADPLRRRSSRWLLARVLADAPVVVRDDVSQAALVAAGVVAEIDVDLAWELPSPAPRETGDGVVVAIGPVAGSGAWRPGRRRLVGDDPGPVIAAIDRVRDRVGGPIRFVGFRGARDEAYARVLAAEFGDDAVVVEAERALAALQAAAVVVTSRYHAALLAVAAGVPVFADLRQGKLAALAATPELDDRIVGFDDWIEVGAAEPGRVGPYRRPPTGATDAALARLAATARPGAG